MPRQERTKSGTGIYHVMLGMKDDSNGALTYDSNRGINSITYDYSHYPSTIARLTQLKTVYNDYTPDGKKLFSRHLSYIPNGNGSNSRVNIQDLYIDDLMLRGGTPLMWRFNGGYVELNANGAPTSWNYYVTDHLGSTRMVVDSNDSIKEVINYYPFGSEMRMTNPALLTGGTSHPYRFTGKELDKLNNLNMYDFGARWYDVAGVPMWTSVDPLCEKYYNISPYAYCAGDPVNRFDPDGRDDYEIDKDGYIKNTTSWINKIKAFFGYGRDDDRIFIKGIDEPLLTFPKGTVTNIEDRKDYSKFEIVNKDYAEKAFQTIISNTDVEWAHIRHEDVNFSSSLIINNHNDQDVSKSTIFARMYKKRGESIPLFEHSHPLQKDYRLYGVPNIPFSYPPSSDDRNTAKYYPQTVFKVYDVYNKHVYEYNKNGIKQMYKW